MGANSERPRRIQLRRTKGWSKPAGAVIVARPGRFGNPFTFSAVQDAGYTREGAVAAFEDWLAGNLWACPADDAYEARRQAILESLPELRGKDLACWCPLDQPCHADVLLRLANAEPDEMAEWDGEGRCPKCQGHDCDPEGGCIHDE